MAKLDNVRVTLFKNSKILTVQVNMDANAISQHTRNVRQQLTQ